MKKTILIGIISLLLIGSVIAGLVLTTNKDITIDRDRKQALLDKGIPEYDIKDYRQGQLYKRCLISPSEYNLPCSHWINSTMIEGSIDTYLDDWEKERIERIADVIIMRESRATDELIREGKTIIK